MKKQVKEIFFVLENLDVVTLPIDVVEHVVLDKDVNIIEVDNEGWKSKSLMYERVIVTLNKEKVHALENPLNGFADHVVQDLTYRQPTREDYGSHAIFGDTLTWIDNITRIGFKYQDSKVEAFEVDWEDEPFKPQVNRLVNWITLDEDNYIVLAITKHDYFRYLNSL